MSNSMVFPHYTNSMVFPYYSKSIVWFFRTIQNSIVWFFRTVGGYIVSHIMGTFSERSDQSKQRTGEKPMKKSLKEKNIMPTANQTVTDFTVNLNSDAERESYQRAVNSTLTLLMQVISNCVFLKDPETLAAIRAETDSLFRQADKMMSQKPQHGTYAPGGVSWVID